MDVEEALELYVTQLRADGRAKSTVEQHRCYIRLLGEWLREEGLPVEVEEIDHGEVARFLCSARASALADGRPKKPGSMNTLRSVLKGFFKYAHEAGIRRSNPARLVRRAICGPAPPRALSEEEEGRFLEALTDAAELDRVLFTLLLRTGLRIGSALGLDIPDVDLDRRELQVRVTKSGHPGVVFLPQGLVDPLGALIGPRCRGPVFRTVPGRRLSSRQAQLRFASVARAAGIQRATPHACRHTFATRVLERTGNLVLVQRALGHRSVASTMIYAYVGDAQLRAALDR